MSVSLVTVGSNATSTVMARWSAFTPSTPRSEARTNSMLRLQLEQSIPRTDIAISEAHASRPIQEGPDLPAQVVLLGHAGEGEPIADHDRRRRHDPVARCEVGELGQVDLFPIHVGELSEHAGDHWL